MRRRKFIGQAALAGGALIAPAAIAAPTGTGGSMEKQEVDALLDGVIDMMVHGTPDTQPRSVDELTFAREAHKVGYRAVLYKSNDFSCHDRAYIIRQVVPQFEAFGSLCLNRLYGDKVNPYAIEAALRTAGNLCKYVWLPTLDAVYHLRQGGNTREGIPVLDGNGNVLPEVVRVMELCAEADIVLASGHSSPEESLILSAKAREVGLKKFVITHVNSWVWTMTHAQIRQAIDLGAFIELSFLTNFWGPGTGISNQTRLSWEEFTDFAKINPERTFISSDLGQVGMPHPIEAMRTTIKELLKSGIPQKDVDWMVRHNPAHLLGLDKQEG